MIKDYNYKWYLIIMNMNVLNDSNIIKISVSYIEQDGVKRIFTVKKHYLEEGYCFFIIDSFWFKPKLAWRTKLEIKVYTALGVFVAKSIIKEIDFVSSQLMIEAAIPKKWECRQLRFGTRKIAHIPFKIKDNNGELLSGITNQVSVTGLTFMLAFVRNDLIMPSELVCELDLSSVNPSFSDVMELVIKYVRHEQISKEDNETGIFYAYKFTRIMPLQKQILRELLFNLG